MRSIVKPWDGVEKHANVAKILLLIAFLVGYGSEQSKLLKSNYLVDGDVSYSKSIPFNDFGAYILLEASNIAVKKVSKIFFHSTHSIDSKAIPLLFFLLIAWIAVLLSISGIDLKLYSLWMIALYILVTKAKTPDFFSETVEIIRWPVALNEFLCSVLFIYSVSEVRRKFFSKFFLFNFLSIIAFMQLMRQDSGFVPLVISSSIILLVFLYTLLLKFKRSVAEMPVSLKNTAIVFGILLLLCVSMKPMLKIVISTLYNKKISEVKLPEHGSGNPLYLGLGYSENPYNIGWRDGIGSQHYYMYLKKLPKEDAIRKSSYSVLFEMWKKTVIEDPWILVKNTFYKFQFISGFMLKQSIDPMRLKLFSWDIRVSKVFTILYPIALLFLLYLFIGLFMKFNLINLLFGFAGLALAAGSLLPAFLTYPEYIYGNYGMITSIALVIFPGFIYLKNQNKIDGAKNSELYTNYRKIIFSGTLVIVIVGMSFLLYRTWANNGKGQELYDSKNPVEKIQEWREGFVPNFNRLSETEKREVLERLKKNNYSQSMSYKISKSSIENKYFFPEFIVSYDGNLYIFATVEKDWKKPEFEWVQGYINSLVYILKDDEKISDPYNMYIHSNRFDTPNSNLVLYLPDSVWNGSLRVFAIPLTPKYENGKTLQLHAGWPKIDSIDYTKDYIKNFEVFSKVYFTAQ